LQGELLAGLDRLKGQLLRREAWRGRRVDQLADGGADHRTVCL
jgi:hypothetical protein